ncbi:ABC transporter ATP-binding protein [Spiribacter vilamensis]|uniref:Phospholipid/cholesterol/gamma-HCH transport system ATP-binding protein n=1 Tax=Spiribacter vilamensis TaxID=531306 RepID=A0A4Q8CYC9_9GAMM|nr:ABC transporter ATP-binding protein [Spiribacter vilamensis]RZU97887.1 phospholipid/cholesterol/gamma-HCH transport system ATP-binding protein [Spiribacter vilamensis]TVO61196.1 ABC transporter ATP-binding protein [Spiribacter vilamensis]
MPASQSEALIDLSGVVFSRGQNRLFNGIDLQVYRGEVVAIMGPSGTGKTTLLRLIGGQLRAAAGRVAVDGESVAGLSRRNLYRLRRRMGVLFQSGALFTDMNCFDNVAFPLREHTRLPEVLIRTIVLMKLEAVGLRGVRDFYPGELSGGMSRRVSLARALALDPEIILYDEPFAGQDPISMGALMQLIRQLNDALGLTSVVVSHDVGEALQIADRAYVISDGRVIESGTPAELRNSKSAWVDQFLNALPDGPVPFHYPAPSMADELRQGGR